MKALIKFEHPDGMTAWGIYHAEGARLVFDSIILPVDGPLLFACYLVEGAYEEHRELVDFILRNNFRETQKGE